MLRQHGPPALCQFPLTASFRLRFRTQASLVCAVVDQVTVVALSIVMAAGSRIVGPGDCSVRDSSSSWNRVRCLLRVLDRVFKLGARDDNCGSLLRPSGTALPVVRHQP